jgi:hemerythrin-like domain-containing protein
MYCTDILKQEHEVILGVLNSFDKEAKHIYETATVDHVRISKYLDFLRNFADKCHHLKEEDTLFPKMNERGMPSEGGPIGVMLYEHEIGRKYLQNIDDLNNKTGTDTATINSIVSNIHGYYELLTGHIFKENNILFEMANNILTDEDNKNLLETFEHKEKNELGEGFHEKYKQLAEELVK